MYNEINLFMIPCIMHSQFSVSPRPHKFQTKYSEVHNCPIGSFCKLNFATSHRRNFIFISGKQEQGWTIPTRAMATYYFFLLLVFEIHKKHTHNIWFEFSIFHFLHG